MQADNTSAIRFGRDAGEDVVYRELRQRIRAYFAGSSRTRFADTATWIKGSVLLIMICAAYTGLLFLGNTMVLAVLWYVLFGWLSLTAAFNFAHDAAHGALSRRAWVNSLVYEAVFNFQGSNAYLWKIRHIHSHHLFPNVDGCDADLDGNILIRLSAQQAHRPWHRWQHLYAPVLYMFYTLIWVFHKDFAFFFRKQHANLRFRGHAPVEFIKLIAYKLLYLAVYLFLPMYMLPLPAVQVFAAFLIMHGFLSLFLLFTFLISHYVMEAEEPDFACPGQLRHTWAMHQLDVSVDFHAEQRWANFIFGGFNTHIAHHLFPDICHVHYPALTGIIKAYFQEKGIPYKEVSFLGGIRSHLRLLKKLGRGEGSTSCVLRPA